MTWKAAPAVSVVVATHRRRRMLEELLDALAAQEGIGPAGLEVVVVDDGSDDGTWEDLEQRRARGDLQLVTIRRRAPGGPAVARNAGWRASRGEIVLFTDDDCRPAPGWVTVLSAALQERGAAVGLAQGLTQPEREHWDGSGPFARTMWVLEEDGFYATCNMAYRRSLLEELDGFDEQFRHPFGEDTDLAWRAIEKGAEAVFVEDAVVFHAVWPSSWPAHVRDRRRRESMVLAARLHPQLRARFYRPYWYQGSHARALLAGAGLGLAAVLAAPPVGRRAGMLAALAAAPYVHYRLTERRLPCRPRNEPAVIALALLADLIEVGVLARASARYRTLLL